MAGSDALRQAMVEGLALRGELDQRWRAVVSEVPRHEFIPELVWCHDRDRAGDCDLVPLRRSEDPQRWLEGAYANSSVCTQVDDGHSAGADGCGFEVTSSASMPAVVSQMLTALAGRAGDAGTGDRHRYRIQRRAARPPARRRQRGQCRDRSCGGRSRPVRPGPPPGTAR